MGKSLRTYNLRSQQEVFAVKGREFTRSVNNMRPSSAISVTVRGGLNRSPASPAPIRARPIRSVNGSGDGASMIATPSLLRLLKDLLWPDLPTKPLSDRRLQSISFLMWALSLQESSSAWLALFNFSPQMSSTTLLKKAICMKIVEKLYLF